MIKQNIQEYIVQGIAELYNNPVPKETVQVQSTKKEFTGDFTVVVFPFLKISKKSPEQTAHDLGLFLMSKLDFIEGYNVIKGFLNIELTNAYWTAFLDKTSKDESFGKCQKNQHIVIEYSSPNTNKPLHLGHIRNNLLGQSIADILTYAGHKVTKVNLVNDRGIHICKSMLAWQKWGQGETPESSKIKGDHLAGKYYVLFDKAYKIEIEQLVTKGLKEEEAKKQAPLITEAQNMLLLWEQNDPEVRNLWQKMNKWVLEGFELTYKKLGISFDKTYFESSTYLMGKSIIEEGLSNNIFFKKEDGSVWVDLTNVGLDEKLLLRADGTSVYMSQDLGTAQLRYNDYKADRFIYVVGNEQNYHFDVLKHILKRLSAPYADGIYHLSYGMVELPEGKMKSREGKVVDADDLIEEMIRTARTHTESLGKMNDVPQEEADELYFNLAMGALKYFILKIDPKKNMIFNPEESIDFNGNTGPFIQYAYVRIQSILSKIEQLEMPLTDSLKPGFIENKEKSLLNIMHAYPDTIEEAALNLSPALLANYLYELAREFNQFYHECPILKENDTDKQMLRIKMIGLCAHILRSGMRLLGVEMPNRM